MFWCQKKDRAYGYQQYRGFWRHHERQKARRRSLIHAIRTNKLHGITEKLPFFARQKYVKIREHSAAFDTGFTRRSRDFLEGRYKWRKARRYAFIHEFKQISLNAAERPRASAFFGCSRMQNGRFPLAFPKVKISPIRRQLDRQLFRLRNAELRIRFAFGPFEASQKTTAGAQIFWTKYALFQMLTPLFRGRAKLFAKRVSLFRSGG